VALADGRDLDLAAAHAARVEEGHEGVEDEQRLALVGLALGVGADDVVRGDLGAHRAKP
jgi:hypothetical protein